MMIIFAKISDWLRQLLSELMEVSFYFIVPRVKEPHTTIVIGHVVFL